MNGLKVFVPIYLFHKTAVSGFKDTTILSQNPVELAASYAKEKCDAFIIFDLSNTDEEHDEALDLIKEICETVEVPVMGAGNVKRMEDVKKLLYAGCNQAILNYSNEGNVEITEEVSKKFGADKIAAAVYDASELKNHSALIEAYINRVLLIYTPQLEDCLSISKVPVISFVGEENLQTLKAAEGNDMLEGITGSFIQKYAAESNKIKNILMEHQISVYTEKPQISFDNFKVNQDGLIPVITQDCMTDEVLMLAYMNRESFEKTIETGRMVYFSRSRQTLWQKGETSGHYQYVKSLVLDCDNDTILAKVIQVGAACHTGNKTCFFKPLIQKKMKEEKNPLHVFMDVYDVILDRKQNPKEGSYTNYLFDKGIDKILKKLGEEATEIVIAAKNPNPNEIKYEISDFLYHMMVLMAEKDVTWEEITEELAKR